jgi:hypothetical protein
MSISQAQYIDLLVKKLYGVATTDNAENKSPSNESIPSPDLNRGDTLWTEANQIPEVAANITNLTLQYGNSNPIQCTPDTTAVPILNALSQPIYPTWLTNVTEWIPPEFGGSYSVQAYVGPANIANLTGANVTFISTSGEGSSANPGEFYFDYQAGLLYFIGETIPNVLTTGNVVYITGYQYTGLTGVTNLPSNTTIGNINIVDTTMTSTDINGNVIIFAGSSGVTLPSGNTTQRPSNVNIGTTRFNTTINSIETWDGAEWITGGNIITPGTITDQQITPDGTSDTYTLDQTSSSAGILVSINGVTQIPDIAYTVTGNAITFTQVPLTEDLIDIRYISYATTVSSLTNSSGNASITVTPAGNILFTTNGNVLTTMSANSVAIAGGLSTTGNITTSGYFIGTFAGNVSGNVVAPGSNTQVLYNNGGNLAASAGFTFDQASNVMIVTGNVTGANILTGGYVSATGNIIGGNISGTNLAGNLTSGAQANITSVGTLTSLTVNGNIDGGNISASLINSTTINAVNIGNSSTEFSGANVSVTGNITGANLIGTIITASQPNITTIGTLTDLSVTGNVIAGRLAGEGGNLSNITAANINGTVGNANTALIAYSVSGANVTGTVATASVAGTVTTNAQPNITSVGTLTSLNVNGIISATGNIHNEGNILSNGIISTTGNVTGLYFFGNGSQLSGIASSYGNSNVASYLPTYTGNLNPNNISAAGNIQGSYILGNGAFLTGLPASYSNTNVASYLAIYTGNLSAGNISVTGNIAGNILNIIDISSTGNIIGVTISTSGNVTAPYFIGNLIGNISGNLTVPGSNTEIIYNNNGQANASPGLTFNFSSNALVSTGTITGSNFLTGGVISAVGHIIGNHFIGSGNTLSNITAANIVGDVANATYATTAGTAATVTTNAQPNITSVGILSSLSVSGNVIPGNLVTSGTITATGNISTAGYFIGNFQGNVSGNLTVPGSNTQVLYNNNGNAGASAGLTFDAASNALVSTGTITGSNFLTGGYISAGGNVIGNYFIGNAATLSAISGANVTGTVANATYAISAGTAETVTTNAQPNITSIGTLTGLSVSGNINSNNLITPGIVSATGNISTAGYFIGNFQGNITGNLTVPGSNTQLIYNNNGNAGASAGLTFDSGTNALISTGTITSSNFLTGGYISATGIVYSNQFVGAGNALSNIQGSNVSGTVANATYSTSADSAATVTTNAQPNITSVGTLTSLTVTANTNTGNLTTDGTISAAGNIIAGTGNYFIGNFLGNISGNLQAPGTNTQVLFNNNGNAGANAGFTFNAGTGAVSVTGNVNSGNINTIGNISVGGNIIGGNISITNLTGTSVSVTGTITASQFSGAGNTLSNIQGANISGNVATATTATAVTGNAQANITSVGILTSLSVSGNATPGNLITAGIISATGNISTAGYFLGNFQGNISGNLTVPGSNTQVIYNNGGQANASAGFTFNAATNAVAVSGNTTSGNVLTSGVISATGNITGGNISATNHTGTTVSATGTITASQFSGSGNTLSNIQGANVSGNVSTATTAGTVTTNAQSNITSVGTLTSLNVTGNISANNLTTSGLISATGNIYSTTVVLAGSGGGISASGTVQAGNILTAGVVSATGNVTGNYFIGNGALLSGVSTTSSNINNGTSNVTVVSSGGNVTTGVAGTSNVVVVASTGQYVTGIVSASGNVYGNYIVSGSGIGGNITGANVISGNTFNAITVSASGNITGNYFIGNGSLLTGISGGSGGGANIANGTSNVTVVSSGGNITTGVGGTANVIVIATTGQYITGLTSVSGNITAGNILTAGLMSSTGNAIHGNITTAGLASVTGNVTAGNILTAGLMSSTGNAIHGNILTAGLISATGNATAGNILTAGLISATGNIYGNAFISTGNGAGSLSGTGNITGGNLISTGIISTAGNIYGGNIINAGLAQNRLYTVATLPAATTAGNGTRAFVTDGNTTTFYANVGSGGANNVPVFSDGTSWRVG